MCSGTQEVQAEPGSHKVLVWTAGSALTGWEGDGPQVCDVTWSPEASVLGSSASVRSDPLPFDASVRGL